jgi:hypothetical protein
MPTQEELIQSLYDAEEALNEILDDDLTDDEAGNAIGLKGRARGACAVQAQRALTEIERILHAVEGGT